MATASKFTWFVCVALLAACSAPEEHRIPDGVRGDIYILTGYPSGVPAKRERGKIVFEIPRTQILVTQDQPSDGWHTTSFVYLAADGSRTKLTYEPSTIPETPESLRDDRQIAWFMRTGEIQAHDLPCPIRFMQYYVGTPAHLLSRTVDESNEQQLRVEQYVRENRVCP